MGRRGLDPPPHPPLKGALAAGHGACSLLCASVVVLTLGGGVVNVGGDGRVHLEDRVLKFFDRKPGDPPALLEEVQALPQAVVGGVVKFRSPGPCCTCSGCPCHRPPCSIWPPPALPLPHVGPRAPLIAAGVGR